MTSEGTGRRQLLIVSNREPCIHDFTAAGGVITRRPASGLISALEPVVQACGGVWIAHGAGTADRATVDAADHLRAEHGDLGYVLRRVWLSPEEERGYYYGFANEGLWPLCHMAFAPPVFRRQDWESYELVNQRFADAIAEEIHAPAPIVLVQDYHFALVPQLLRERCPDAIIVAFWHIPWPTADQFARCPYHQRLIAGLLGSDIVGLQTTVHCERFLDTVEDDTVCEVDRQCYALVNDQHEVRVRAYPISIEWPNRWASQLPPIEECRRAVRSKYGIDQESSLVVSVDRLDYTKGFDERLAAIERLLELQAAQSRTISFLQVAAPTRTGIERYSALAARVRDRISAINQRFGSRYFEPVKYVEQYLEPADVFRCYRAADVCYVGTLDDGMNLVAKEFVAARTDERGVLVLSQFAGAARELADALIVNPFDAEGVAEVLARAVQLTDVEQQARMRELRRQIAAHTVFDWASAMLADAEDAGGPRPAAAAIAECGVTAATVPLTADVADAGGLYRGRRSARRMASIPTQT